MAYGDGCARLQEQQRRWFADDSGAADDNGVAAGDRNTLVFKQFHHTIGGAREKNRFPCQKRTGVLRMKSIHILGRVYGAQGGVLVDLFGQGQLQQDAVNFRIGVQVCDAGEQIPCCCAKGQRNQVRMQPGLGAGADLVSHVHGGCGVLSDLDYGKAGHTPARGHLHYAQFQLFANCARNRGAIDNSSLHA